MNSLELYEEIFGEQKIIKKDMLYNIPFLIVAFYTIIEYNRKGYLLRGSI